MREHFHMEINECVVMYLDIDQINRPAVPDDVSPVKGILSHGFPLEVTSGAVARVDNLSGVVPMPDAHASSAHPS